MTHDDDDWVRLPVVEQLTGARKTFVYAAVKTRGFPAPRKLSARVSVWNVGAIRRWVAEQPTLNDATAANKGRAA